MNDEWYETEKELRQSYQEAIEDYEQAISRSPGYATQLVKAIYKIGEIESQLLVNEEKRTSADGIRGFIRHIRSITAPKVAQNKQKGKHGSINRRSGSITDGS